MQYHRLVPPDSFLGHYMIYMQTQETATAFDFWSGLWCISSACARATYVARPRAPIYLNLFVVLVGESGVARKTTSVAMSTRCVRRLLGAHHVGHIDSKVTPERLDQLLMERTQEYGTAQICITCPELAVFMGTESYVAHMPIMLTDLYDCPDTRIGGGTVSRGSVLQEHVWVNLLSASTPTWLLKTVNPNVIEGGFTSRCYFIISNEPKRLIPWPEDPDPDLFKDLQDDLHIIANEVRTRGPIHVTDTAMERFRQWYATRERSIDPFKQSFEAREDAHVLRVAALLCINDGSFAIKRGHVNIAIRLISEVKVQSGAIFETGEVRSKFAAGLDVLRAQLISAGMDPVLRSQLYNKVRYHVSYQEFLTLLEVLHEIRAIQRFEVRTGERGRPAEWVRGTNLLLARGLGESVLERLA